MERFDILDVRGIPIGKVADKGTKLINGQYYLGVHAYIYNFQNRFLLQQRSFDKQFLPGGWDIHLGHVIAGETSFEGVIREVYEEIGLSLMPQDIRLIHRVFWDEEYHHIVDIYFICLDYDLNTLVLQEEEVIGVKDISCAEMIEIVEQMFYRPETYRKIVQTEIQNLNSRL